MNQTKLELTITGITRKCYLCGETKPLTMFRTNKREKYGYAYECLECSRAYSRKYVTEHAEERNSKRVNKYDTDEEWAQHERARNIKRNHKQEIKNRNRVRRNTQNRYERAYNSAKLKFNFYKEKKQYQFNISLEYALQVAEQQNYKCALTGIPFSDKKTGDKENDALLPSIDRINSKLGYIPGNIQWTTIWANTAKLDYTTEFFHKMCTLTTKNLENNNANKTT